MELAIGRFESEDLTSIVVSVVLQLCQITDTSSWGETTSNQLQLRALGVKCREGMYLEPWENKESKYCCDLNFCKRPLLPMLLDKLQIKKTSLVLGRIKISLFTQAAWFCSMTKIIFLWKNEIWLLPVEEEHLCNIEVSFWVSFLIKMLKTKFYFQTAWIWQVSMQSARKISSTFSSAGMKNKLKVM